MPKSYFIAGTDTDVGKTLITGYLARYFKQQDKTVTTQKWVHSGCNIPAQYLPEDIARHEQLMHPISESTSHMSCPLVSLRCPYRFKLPASAHLAAENETTSIDDTHIINCYQELVTKADRVLIEGIGGVHVPYSRTATLLDIQQALTIPTILVVANRLGAINHSLLTLELLKHRNIPCIGMIWTSPTPETDPIIHTDNPKIIEDLTGIPVWCSLPYHANLEHAYHTVAQQLEHTSLKQ